MIEGFRHSLGAADRLDFTVIGPAVNLVSRIAYEPHIARLNDNVLEPPKKNPGLI
jgi:hypothetical protein